MKLLGKQSPPDRGPSTTDNDPSIIAARHAYLADKRAAMAKQAEILARLERLGYDFSIATKKGQTDEHQ